MKLVIVESPAKAKTIAGYLGPGYRVRATVGHVRDLPKKELAVDTENTFRPKYETLSKKKQVMSDLRKEAGRCEEILIATDPDREGEIIAYHVEQSLKRVNKRISRVTFREITRPAVQQAVRRPRSVDRKLVAAQQARRVMDRLVGYRISPFLWRWMSSGPGLSAGRVQSAALRLVCEREQAIADFEPQEYWSLEALFETLDRERFKARLYRFRNRVVGSPAKDTTQFVIPDELSARRLYQDAREKSYRVANVTKKTIHRKPPPPFTTSTLQQAASSRLRMSTKATMRVAQQLYEGVELENDERVGLITYMRTDAVRLAEEAVDAIRDLITSTFGADYLPKRAHAHRKKQSASAQDAHEAIRPTHIERRPEDVRRFLTPEQYRLYKLIWERTVASQMAAAVIDRTTVNVASECGTYVFRAVGSVVRFPGYQRLMQDEPESSKSKKKGKAKDEDAEPDQRLPESLRTGLPVTLIELEPAQHFTKPPPRYTEATLVKALEARGIGRPSTYSSIVQTLLSREYALLQKRQFHATDLGLRVNAMLVEHFPALFDLAFTAQMETELDQIAEGRREYKPTLHTFFHDRLEHAISEANQKQRLTHHRRRPAVGTDPSVCPQCGKPLAERTGKYGSFLACTGFPACRYSRSLKTSTAAPDPSTPPCPACGNPMVKRTGPSGAFYGCSTYPACRKTMRIA